MYADTPGAFAIISRYPIHRFFLLSKKRKILQIKLDQSGLESTPPSRGSNSPSVRPMLLPLEPIQNEATGAYYDLVRHCIDPGINLRLQQ